MQRATIQSAARHSIKGFTLVEVMVAIAVLGVLMTIGIPSLVNFIRDTRVSSGTNEFLGAVTLARSEAIKRNRLVTICRSVNAEFGVTACSAAASGLHPGNDWGVGWLVFVVDNPAVDVTNYQPADIVLLRHGEFPSSTFASGATLNSMTFNGSGALIRGTPFAANFNFNNGLPVSQRQVCVSANTGRIRAIRNVAVCSP